jgi:hypothetical protein
VPQKRNYRRQSASIATSRRISRSLFSINFSQGSRCSDRITIPNPPTLAYRGTTTFATNPRPTRST